MDSEDRRIEEAEEDADRERMHASIESPPEERHEESTVPLSRSATGDTASSSSSSVSRISIVREEMTLSRFSTMPDEIGALSRHPTALSRIQTARSQRDMTVGASLRSRTVTRESKKPLPGFGDGKEYPPMLPESDQYVVEFDGPNDPLHAQNWPLRKKVPVAVSLAFVTLTAAFGSSIFSAALGSVVREYGISGEVGVLGVSLYVLGFALGPIVWAPISELYGRRYPLIVSSFGFSIFNLAVATGKDVQTIFICRFFGGFFGACPLTIVGAVFADMFNNRQRGLALTVFAVTVFSGPLLAPFIGGFINMSYLGWRWTEYITTIMGFLGLALEIFLLEEIYPPVILVNKATELRRRTRNWGIHAKQEEIEVDLRELLEKNLSRPLRLLYTEPIILAVSVYMAFVYGIFYLFLTFYPIVFQRIHGMNEGVGGLPFFGMIGGELLSAIYIIAISPSYNRKLAANNNMPVPEWRLPPVMVGGVSFGIGIFWFAWTGYRKDIHWIAPTLSGLATGFGILSIFLNLLNYLVESYLMFAASAIAANTLLRSLFGAVFPLFARQMIEGMGVGPAGSLLGAVAIALVPVPILFHYYGAKLREKSTFAPTFSSANQDSHDNEKIVDDDEIGKIDSKIVEMSDKAKLG